MAHRIDLLEQGFISYAHGTKETLNHIAFNLKKLGNITHHRIVESGDTYELYVIEV